MTRSMASLLRVLPLLYLAACARQPTTALSSTARTALPIPPSETATPSPALKTPTPDIQSELRAEVESALHVRAYDADLLRENATDPGQSEALLASIPPDQYAAFLRAFLEAPMALENADDIRSDIENPALCERGSYIAINASRTYMSWYKVWGSPDFETIAKEAGLPGPSEAPYAIVDCDNPAEGLDQVEALIAGAEETLAKEEEPSEAILALMLRDLFARTFKEQIPFKVELERSYPLELITYDLTTGEPLSFEYYPIDLTQDNGQEIVDALEAVYVRQPPYMFALNGVTGFAISPDASVPIVGTVGRIANVMDIIGAAVHQMEARYPIGSAQGIDGLTIRETFAIVAKRELFRDFITLYYASSAEDFAGFFWTDFRGDGTHRPPYHSATDALDPQHVFGDNALGHRILDFRNCTVKKGVSLGGFFELIRPIDKADKLQSLVTACEATLALTPSPIPAMEALPLVHDQIVHELADLGLVKAFGGVPAEIACLPSMAQMPECHAVAFRYFTVAFPLRIHLARFSDAAAAAAASEALHEELLQDASPLHIPRDPWLQSLNDAKAWMLDDSPNGFLLLGFPRAEILAVLSLQKGVIPQGDDTYNIFRFGLAQLHHLEEFGYYPRSTPIPAPGASTNATPTPLSTVWPPPTPPLAPMAYLPFDGDVGNHSLNRMQSNPHGSIDFNTGVYGQAARFDGPGEEVDLEGLNCLPADSIMTLDFWVNLEQWSKPSNSGPVETIVSCGISYSIGVYFDTWRTEILLSFEPGKYAWLAGGQLQPGTWHHVALRLRGNNATATLFIDGDAVDEEPTFTFIAPAGEDSLLRIGWYEQDQAFAGLIDELHIFDTALSDLEVLKLSHAPGR